MEDGHTLFDYEVGLNDIIQILVKQEVTSRDQSESILEEGDEQTGNSDKEKVQRKKTVDKLKTKV